MSWVTPTPLESYAETLVRENDLFSLLQVGSKRKMFAFISKVFFVICLKSDPRKMVAKGDTLDAIEPFWTWLVDNIDVPTQRQVAYKRQIFLSQVESAICNQIEIEAENKEREQAKEYFEQMFSLQDEECLTCPSNTTHGNNLLDRLYVFSVERTRRNRPRIPILDRSSFLLLLSIYERETHHSHQEHCVNRQDYCIACVW